MTTKTKQSDARDRILAKAEELFYRQGYQATGINQIIEESGVAKATFYAHFPSKDDLCLAYLQAKHRRELDGMKQEILTAKTPLARFMRLIEVLGPWMEETRYKGCAFLNMVPEVANPKSPLRGVGIKHYEEIRRFLEGLTRDLIASDKKKYGHLKAEEITDKYMTLLTGAIALSELYYDREPMDRAVSMVKELVS